MADLVETPSRPRSFRGGTILTVVSRMCGTLQLNTQEAVIGDTITIDWSITNDNDDPPPPLPSERDWIGLFSIDELNPENYIDYRMRGQNLDNEGHIQWTIPSINEHSLQVCFCFYTANNILLAQSETLTVTNQNVSDATPTESLEPLRVINEPIPIKVYDLSCTGLRAKTFGIPDPFVKLTISNKRGCPKQSHHGQLAITSVANHTCSHHWINESFTLHALPTDVIETEIRDKFSFSRPSASHFMGKVQIPLDFLQHQRSITRTYQLQKRLPSDRVSGTVSITISSDLTDLPVDTSVNNETTVLSPVQEHLETTELPERSSDRIRYVRRTLHGDRYRNPSNSHRHYSVIVRRTDSTPDNQLVATVGHVPQNDLHLGLEQFMARSSRNQVMRQNSCPANRRASPNLLAHSSLAVNESAQQQLSSDDPNTSIDDPNTSIDDPNTSIDESSPVTTPLNSPQLIIIKEQGVIDDDRVVNFTTPPAVPSTLATDTLSVQPSFQRIDSVDESVKDHPGFLFLTRNDFYEFIKDSGNTSFKDISLLKLVQSIRSDHSLYLKYSHSSKLVKAINSFALVDFELPDGWEKRVDKGTRKVVYIDHNSQSTTFIDPRLPLPGRELKSLSDDHSVMRTRPVHSTTSQRSLTNIETPPTNIIQERSHTTPPTIAQPEVSPVASNPLQDYSAKIVSFLRQDGIFNILSSRYEQDISHDLRTSIEEIQDQGVPRLERLQNEADEVYFELTIILSLFEEDISHQLFMSNELAPPPPPSHVRRPPATPPDMDLDSTNYMGIPLESIVEFFQSPNVYHSVLSRFGSIQPYMRTLINQFSNSLSFEVADELYNNPQARQFIFQLFDDLLHFGNDSSQIIDDNDITLPISGLPTAVQVRDFMAQENILNRLPNLDPDERSIVHVCGTWDVSLIEFELNRSSVLRDLVLRIADDILHYSNASHTTPVPVAQISHTLNEDFLRKLQQLQSILDINGYASTMYGEQKISVRRDRLLEDAYRSIMGASAKSLRVKRCNVMWDEEEGLDYGGPQREFFFKLSRLLFNPYYGLFEYSSHGSYTVQISQYSSNIDDSHLWFRFAGRVIGYAIIQNNLLDVFFARHIYKSLLNIPFTVNDVEALDVSFYNSLKYVLDNDPFPLELTFTVPEESFGQIIEKELKPGGGQIEVTNQNKKEYVDLMVQWRLAHGVSHQMDSLRKGLREMIPYEYLKPFDPQELEWVIAGTPEINMEDWKSNTQYWGGYHQNHSVIIWFWEAIESFTDEQKLRFLQFTTGTSSIPYEGFKALKGSSYQLQKFTIDRFTGPVDSLIIAHTCFNRIDLPPYRSLEEMKEKLLYAITETDTFETA